MKKILHIFSEINYSGAELMWYASLDILREKGYKIELVSTGLTKGNFAYAFENKGIKVHHIPQNSTLSFLWNIFKLIQLIKPQIIHIHPENKHFYFYYTLFGRFLGSKVIRTVHSVCHSRVYFYGIVMRKLSKVLGAKFVSISKSVQENETRFYKNKTYFINNWADDNRFKSITKEEKIVLKNKLQLPKNKILIVSVGNCAEVKNHKLILKTLQMLNTDYAYIHIGKEDKSRSEVKLSKELGIEDRVCFLGPIKNVEEYLQVCDIFIMPSLHEGVGNAAIEALMSGIKTILTNVLGLHAFKEYGPLVQYTENNKEYLKDLILNLKDLDQGLVRKIRNKLVYKYGVKQGIEKYLELYEN